MKREGFTLIELLVVIAIIALLIAISVSIFNKSGLQAKAIECQYNIRQLSLYLTMYENENETFPHACDNNPRETPPGGYPGSPMYDKIGWWWFNHIIAYSRKNRDKESVILCPSKKMNDIRLKKNVLCGNYGVNLSICKNLKGSRRDQAEFVGMPLSISNIRQPSRSLLVMDSGYSMISWWHVTDIPPAPLVGLKNEAATYVPGLKINKDKTTLWHDQKGDAIDGRHPNKKVNVGYVDGHVERRQADDLFVEKTETGYDKRYPLWSPIKNKND